MLSILRTDAGLVAQVLTGKANGFDELVRRHFNVVYGIAFSYTRNHADAEDLSQEAFLKAYKSLDNLQDTKKFGHWMCVITRNLARTWFARRKREAEVMEQTKAMDHRLNEAVYDDMREALEKQINELDPIPREVLMLHYFSGQSTAEIAKVMNVSRAAVLKRLQRAREALGVKLIHELNIIPPAEDIAKQHRRIIMSSIAASGITWQLTGGSWLSTAASTLMTGKAIATGVIVTGIVTASVVLNPKPEPPGNRLPSASATTVVTITQDSVPESSVVDVPGEITSLDSAVEQGTPLILAETTIETVTTESLATVEANDSKVVNADENPELLKGDWRAYAIISDRVSQEIGIAQFVREGNALTVTGTKEIASLGLKGEVYGVTVFLEVWLEGPANPNESISTGMTRNNIGRLEGEFSAEFDELKVSGMVEIPGGGESIEIQLLLKKLTKEDTAAKEALDAAQGKIVKVQEAILNYMRAKKVTLATLEELVPDFLKDLELITKVDTEVLTYYSMPMTSLDFKPDFGVESRDAWRKFEETKNPGFLLDWEDDLAVVWGTHFPTGNHTLLRLENQTYHFTLEINEGGKISETHDATSDSSETTGPSPQASIRASCQNNMKQMGLVFKMFANECPGEYMPGGFRQVHPEYLSDLNILICPGINKGDVGYEMLYPASNEKDWKEINSFVEGISIEDINPRLYQSQVPSMIEIEDCSDSGGRNVLFLDGHVEHIMDEDWNARMDPYLEYGYK